MYTFPTLSGGRLRDIINSCNSVQPACLVTRSLLHALIWFDFEHVFMSNDRRRMRTGKAWTTGQQVTL